MGTEFKTNQEEFWATEFGDEYIDRNKSEQLLSANINLFSKIFQRTTKIQSIMEFGANIGMNMEAIKHLLPKAHLAAIEINPKAYLKLSEINGITAYNESILNFKTDKKYDFVFTKGVLIHINPDELHSVYKKMYDISSRYICIAEYYSPSPVTIPYRGYSNKLFKRDFAGEMLDEFSNLELIDYGFVYKRDNNFAQDDITWFLIKKKEI